MSASSQAKPSIAAHEGVPVPQRYWAIAALLCGIVMAVLDGSIANVSLPTIARDLGGSPAEAIWVVNAYQLAVVACLLPMSALGDSLGYRKVFLTGLTTFVVASFVCTMATSLPVLVGARILQGIGAAGLMALNMALVRFTYPSKMLGTAVGITAMTVAVSSAAGPTLSSVILSVATWPWLFGINVPLGLLTMAIAWRNLPSPPASHRRFDWVSAVLSATTFGTLFLGVDNLFAHPGRGLMFIAASAVAAVLLYRRAVSQPLPLLPLDLLRIPRFAFSVVASICAFSAQMLGFVSLPFFLQELGRSQVETGFLMTPWPLAVAVAAPLAGRLSDRLSAATLCSLGGIVMAAGLAVLAVQQPGAGNGGILFGMVLAGLGFGFFQSPNNRAMLSSAPLARSGAAGGLQSTARLFGQSVGTAIVAVCFAAIASHQSAVALGVGVVAALAAATVSASRRLGGG
jgi:DHA2 family multidrug resistance protein-like MFS transporter